METSGKKVVELNINDVLPNRFQPRIKFNEEAILELSKSIKEHGVIQPIVVRTIGDKFEIIAGERRYKATCMAGLRTIPAIITDLNDKDSAEVALIENVQRENLTPIEEAISYKKILDMGYITQEELATKLGKTQSTVANKLRLLNLDDEVQESLLNEKISERHARSLLRLTNKTDQKQMLNKIINERLTVRRTDEEIEKLLNGDVKKEEKMEENSNQTFRFINLNQEQLQQPNNNIESTVDNLQNKEITSSQEELKQGKFFNILEQQDNNSNQPSESNFERMFMQNPIIEPENKSNNSNDILMSEINEIENSINNSTNIPPIFKQDEIEDINIEDIDGFDDDLDFIDENELLKKEELENKKLENEETLENNKEINTLDYKDRPQENNKNEEIYDQPIEMNKNINNFKDVLEEIRSCSNKIEEAGYIIETEEYDLEGTYQVIFKINKKD